VAGCPAADLGARNGLAAGVDADLVIGEHDRGLDVVFLVVVVGAASRSLEGQADVEVAGVVGGLHGHREVHGLRRADGLDVLAGQTLHVEVETALLLVAADARLALGQAGATAVVGLLHHPLDRRHAGVEDLDVALGNL
jgi:hypothetical protein